jgi:ribonuclease HII
MVRRFALEMAKADLGSVAGIDEAGRGPWAGPVVAAAVMLDPARLPPHIAARIADSKRLTPDTRARLFEALQVCAIIGVGQASVEEIDALNILKATHLAMRRALEALPIAPTRAAVDGNSAPALPCPAETIIGGDGRVLEIAAASIIAKVTRDRLMAGLAGVHPGYGWERNKGYGTAEHHAAIARFGVTAHHRRSFAPIRAFLQGS